MITSLVQKPCRQHLFLNHHSDLQVPTKCPRPPSSLVVPLAEVVHLAPKWFTSPFTLRTLRLFLRETPSLPLLHPRCILHMATSFFYSDILGYGFYTWQPDDYVVIFLHGSPFSIYKRSFTFIIRGDCSLSTWALALIFYLVYLIHLGLISMLEGIVASSSWPVTFDLLQKSPRAYTKLKEQFGLSLLPRPSTTNPLVNRAHPMVNTNQAPDLEGIIHPPHHKQPPSPAVNIPKEIDRSRHSHPIGDQDSHSRHSVGHLDELWTRRVRKLGGTEDHLAEMIELSSTKGYSDEVMCKAFSATLKGPARVRQKIASHLFAVHQKGGESLEDYVKCFNQTVLEVENPNDKVVVMEMRDFDLYVADRPRPNSLDRGYIDNRTITEDIQTIHRGFGLGGCSNSSRKRNAREANGRAEEEAPPISYPSSRICRKLNKSAWVDQVAFDFGDRAPPDHSFARFHCCGLPFVLQCNPRVPNTGKNQAITSTYHLMMKFPTPTGIGEILRKNKTFKWMSESEVAFPQLKEYLGSPHLLMVPSTGEELTLYLSASPTAVSAVLIRDEDKFQKLVYYVNKAYTIVVLTDQPLNQILQWPNTSGQLLKWSIELSEFHIIYRANMSVPLELLPNPSIDVAKTICLVIVDPKWMDNIIAYLKDGKLLSDKLQAQRIQYRSARFCLLYGTFYKRSFSELLLRCLRSEEADYVFRENHEGICRNHSRAISLAYHMTSRVPADETSYSLVYGIESVVPMEIGMPSFKTLNFDKESNEADL
ncbi:hypothetical protein Acr_24g0006740 [Actinidia rufa]|uniref:Reverse transcriptase/retrotransposon-derived protein RNase H-like domain-containing protein n=1 Tax=Actinidia rufa TaxID=165716 RepID=A0A7J0GVE2_9ERIC|nr:hypothetical protein Acr_24g0006740 [Actinidia rufa]